MSDTELPLSVRIAAHVATTPIDALPASSLHSARRALLDGVGVMLAASGLAPEVRPFVEAAVAQGGVGEATILGEDFRVPAELAAFANGAMSHALDYEDAFDRAPVHPNAASIPALIALSEARGGVSAAELLTAIAVGCDLTCRLGLALGPALERGGWYPPPVLGAIGATAAACRLLGLDERQVRDALSLLLLQNSAPAAIKHAPDSVLRAVREAFPAQAAVQCARLAARGVRGFDAPLEGRGALFATFARGEADAAVLLEGLGEHWWIDALSFKPWPCCRGTHAAVELALRLHASGPEVATATDIVVRGGPVQAMLAEPLPRKQRPSTAIDAKFSLPFTIATALVHGDVDFDHFAADGLSDRRVLAVASRIRFERHPAWTASEATSAQLRLRFPDGRIVEREILDPLGSPTRPLDDAALVDKFLRCAARGRHPWGHLESRSFAEAVLSRPLDARLWPV